MTEQLPLPPYEDVPPEVHDRLRARVLDGLDDAANRSRYRGPVAVAAAAVAVGVVLAAGALVVTGSVPAGPATTHQTTTTTAPRVSLVGPMMTEPTGPMPLVTVPAVSRSAAQPDMDRCWGAIQASGRAAQYPPESAWVPKFRLSEPLQHGAGVGRTVVAIRANGRPLFCETTPTSVSVSDPNRSPAIPDRETAQVLGGSDDGVLVGVTDATAGFGMAVITQAGPAVVNQDGRYQLAPEVRDGMFVGFANPHGFAHSMVLLYPSWPLPDRAGLQIHPPAMVNAVDRPQHPDRTSPAGQQLQSCLDTVTGRVGPVLDEASWRPGATVTRRDGAKVMITTNDSEVAVCLPDFSGMNGAPVDGFWFDGSSTVDGPAVPAEIIYWDWTNSSAILITGVLDPNVGRVRFSYPNQTVDATIVGGTFGVQLPTDKDATVTVFDRSGHQIYQGDLYRLPNRPHG